MKQQRNYDLATVKGRLQTFLRERNITQAEFATLMGVSPTYVGAMRRGLSTAKASRLAEVFPELNRDWLLYGQGEMLNESADEAAEADLDEETGTVVPLLPVQAFAGNLQAWSKPVLLADCEKIISPVSPVDFAIRISGDSMEPEFADGTTLFVRRITDRNFMPWGHPVVIDSSNGVIFKLIYPPEERDDDDPWIEARSLNPRYPPLRISTDTILGIYRVCASIRIYNTI
ncbi:MAG: helix-turn-helix domain-containing protein [Muribaculaceae bacterium]|nr:helix-turn-helix domain-containing protein [Muribaculaceae bacterium]